MTPAAVALLAAGIPAAVAAGTFAVTEILKAVDRRKSMIASGIEAVAIALERQFVAEAQPFPVREFMRVNAYARLLSRLAHLLAVVRKRDRVIVMRLLVMVDTAVKGRRRISAGTGGQMLSLLRTWQINPKKARQDAANAHPRLEVPK